MLQNKFWRVKYSIPEQMIAGCQKQVKTAILMIQLTIGRTDLVKTLVIIVLEVFRKVHRIEIR